MVWLVVLTLLVAATAILIWPLWRHTDHPLPAGVDGLLEDADQERHEEKKRLLANLRTLRLDLAEGKLAEEDFRPLEAESQQQSAVSFHIPAFADDPRQAGQETKAKKRKKPRP